ncbi:HCNGP-like protein-domain-containing protein [Absidia repens]|uniref:HCNGP-like protein-domain-containing protein n=1 Tax=Absidia repens TaxID=90262 RepID=A0A1X2I5V7_9FUNG|nr:HCNGP-like protein-domain-containing protein [Absidia repens]
MGKSLGLVNYSDDEDQSSTSSDEDNQQQQDHQQKQPQPHATQPQSHPSTVIQPQLRSNPQPIQQQRTKYQEDQGTKLQGSSAPTQGSTVPVERIKPLPYSPLVFAGDRSTQLKTILTRKSLPGVENWGIPPEPQSECDADRLEKIKHFLSLRQSGQRLNDHLQRNKAFRNPRIYAKLVEFVDLNETGSNFSAKDFDPTAFPASSYIDGILETQKRLADEKAQLQAQGRSQLSFVSSSSNKPPPTTPSLDTNAKFAAAMANAAKIANKIAKPMPQQQQQQPTSSTTTATASSISLSSHDHNDHSSNKRSSHRQWDRRDDKRRHRH